MNMVFVYAIRSIKRNYIYVGMTCDLDRRIAEHENGENRSTKAYRPFELIFVGQYDERSTARSKEKYFKSGVGKEFLKLAMPRWRNW